MELLSPIVNVNDLINKGYVDKKFLAGLKVSGDNLAYTLNGTDYLLTVPYATNAAQLGKIASGYYTYYQRLVYGQYNRLFSFQFTRGEKGQIVFRVVSHDSWGRNTAIYAVHWGYTASVADGKAIGIKCVYSEGSNDRRAAISAVKRTTSLDGSTTIVGAYDIFYNAGVSTLNGTCEILSYPTTITFLTRTPILATADDIADAAYTSAGGALYSGTFIGSLQGNATSASKSTYSDYVRITDTEPTTITSYCVPFVEGTIAGTNYYLRGNDGFVYRTLEGTASEQGWSILALGNSTASGTAGNKQGRVRFFGASTSYTDLVAKAVTSANTLYLPAGSGTLVYHTNNTAIGSSTLPVYVDSTGKVTACNSTLDVNINGTWKNIVGYTNGAREAYDMDTNTGFKTWAWNVDTRNTNVGYFSILKPSEVTFGLNAHGTIITAGAGDTHMFLGVNYSSANGVVIGAGNADKVVWTANLIHSANYTTYLNNTYVNVSGDTMTGKLTVPYLTISDTNASAHIQFSRARYNYICAPSGGIIAIMPNNGGHSATTGYYFDGSKLYAGTNNSKALGSPSYRWSNVYSVLGNFSGQITSSVATGTAPFVVASTTAVSNLNADLLDGYHSSDFVHSSFDSSIAQYNETEWIKFFIFTHTSTSLDSAVVIDFYNSESGASHTFGRLLITARGTALRSADIANWGSAYIPEIRVTSDDGLTFALWMNAKKTTWHPYMKAVLFNRIGITSYYWVREFSDDEPTGTNTNYTVVRTGLSAKATALETSRTLWGQPFNGSANVSGDMTGVGSITASGNASFGGTLKVSGASTLIGVVTTGSALYTHGKTTTSDGKAGFYAASGYVGISGATPHINFYFNNSTTMTSQIKENVSGRLYFSNQTYHTGAAYFGNGTTYYFGSTGNVNCNTLTAAGVATLKSTLTVTGDVVPASHGGATIGTTATRWNVGYFKSAVNVGGANTSIASGASNTSIAPGYMEMSSTTPFIDFHHGNTTTDHTNRIIEGLSGQLTVTGKLRVGLQYTTSTDYNFYVNGTAYVNGTITSAQNVSIASTKSYQFGGTNVLRNNGSSTILSNISSTTMYFRPCGDSSTTGQVTIRSGGLLTAPALTSSGATSTNTLSVSSTSTFTGLLTANGNIKAASYINIGSGRIEWDSTNGCLKVVGSDGSTACSIYATGGMSALGEGSVSSDGTSSSIVEAVYTYDYIKSNTLTTTSETSYVASAYAVKSIYDMTSSLNTTVSAHGYAIGDLQTATFTKSGDYSTGINLTWFISSGGGRMVNIPTWNSLGCSIDDYDNTPCLISNYFIEDIMGWVSDQGYLTSSGTIANANKLKGSVPSDTAVSYTTNYLGLYYAGGGNAVANKPTSVDAFGMLSMQTASGYTGQILISANTSVNMYWKTGASGSLASASWKMLLDNSNTSFSQTLTSGTKIGEITIGGTSTNIYAPESTAAVTVVNNLTSTSTTSALSANQGRVLKNSITDIESVLSSLGTSSQLDYTSSITSGSTNLVTSGGVYSYMTNNYLPLSGGTLTGSLSIEGSSNGISLYDSSGNENVLILGSGGISCSTVNGYTLAAACAKGVSDSSSAGALSSSDTNLATVRDIYYGTPKINNSKAYTSSTTIYAPTAGGTEGYYLKGTGTTTAPTWQAYSTSPTSGSTTLITSDAVYTALANQKVSVSQTLTSGTEIGSITVGSTKTTLYAPASSGSSSSSVDFTSIASNVVPSADITYNLGTGTKRWNYVYARYIRSYSSISPVYDTGATLGSATTRFSCIYSQSATFGDYMDVDNQVAYIVEFYNNDLYGYDEVQDEVWSISSYGYAQFMSVVDTSDQTKKNILGNTSLTLSQIANAPSVYFTWKNNKNTARQAGTLAQYWKSVLPEVVTGEEGNMGLMYGQTAVISAITIAKETETIKQRVDRLEAENKVLRDEVEELKNQLNSL